LIEAQEKNEELVEENTTLVKQLADTKMQVGGDFNLRTDFFYYYLPCLLLLLLLLYLIPTDGGLAIQVAGHGVSGERTDACDCGTPGMWKGE